MKMENEDSKYRYAFNELADVMLNGNVVNPYCWNREDCEKSLNIVLSIVGRMKILLDRMED